MNDRTQGNRSAGCRAGSGRAGGARTARCWRWRFAAALSVVLLAGCATDAGLRDEQRLALYHQHSGAPVDSFHYSGRISGWTPLGDRALALWTRPSQAWLLELTGRCTDLAFAHAITLTHQSRRVHARFDDVVALGPGTTHFPCRIQTIRPLDTKALKQAERDMRDSVEMMERGQAPGAAGGT
ncbi:DUF6491 family protein [Lysobacter sp. A3-1-A15]|uniref:DUF6491 family protein n=1 Tax=Novilysobacter viscosus TaxID=3098602 RepID=UPI003982E2D6